MQAYDAYTVIPYSCMLCYVIFYLTGMLRYVTDLDDDEEVEDALANSLVEMDNRQATWVQLCVAEANQDNKSSMESMDQVCMHTDTHTHTHTHTRHKGKLVRWSKCSHLT